MTHKPLVALTTLIVLAGVFLFGCNAVDTKVSSKTPTGPTATAYADGARRVTMAEFDELVKKGQAFIVDVRNQAAYDEGHIPGAVLIPAGEILNHISELPRDKTIVTYCS